MTDKKDKKSTQELIGVILDSIDDVKGEDVVVLDLSEVDGAFADYFVIATGNSNTQVNALSSSVERKTRAELKQRPIHVEGKENGTWVLLDYVDVVVHVFQPETREYYDIESLWNDAKTVEVNN